MPPHDIDTEDPALAETAARASSNKVSRHGPGVGGEDWGEAKRSYVRGIFSQIAPRYDLLNHLLSFNLDRGWRRRALAELRWQVAPRGTYLDLCAGTLDLAASLAREPGFDGYVVGADFAEPMLRAGRGKIASARVGPLTADALQLPIADASVSGAVIGFGLRNVADIDACLLEVHRVLAPEGRLVVLEFSTPRSRPIRALYHLYFHRVLPAVGGLLSGHRTAYRYLPRSVRYFPSEMELADHFTRAGFRDVRWQRLLRGVAAIHSATK